MTRIPDKISSRLPNRLPDELRFSNYCLELNGVSQYVDIPINAGLHLHAGSFTCEIWFSHDTTVSASTEIMVIHSDPYMFMRLANLITTQHGQIYNGVAVVTLFPNYILYDNLFHQMVLVRDTVAGRARLYVDGALHYNKADALGDLGATTYLRLGFNSSWAWWRGLFNEFRLLQGVAFTGAQVQESFQRGYARRQVGTQVVLRLNENFGLVAEDESGFGNNGDLLPAPTPPTWRPVAKYQLLAEGEL